ncbi:LamG-like jellyroll fold domain-containing protein [Actinoplanes sp. NPDC051633]|uniref:LamG-like jellyroll fold domain-containing protein n=1 Tax=Actinoplanes sp. NPDC051633 TaxID=3155670 RepID=UPI00341288B2
MKLPARVLTLALILVPAVPALAATTTSPAAKASPVVVARYSFDSTAAGKVPDLSGRGVPLTIRSADRGAVRFVAAKTGRYIGLPLRCAAGASTCPRALLEGADDPDLDPGTRSFRWGATIAVAKSQLAGSSNILQKGVATTESQWKMQVGETHGRAQCVVVGRGSSRAYLVRSTVAVADGKWHKILCVRSSAALTIVVDGVSRGTTRLPAGMSILNDKPLRIGGPNFNTSSDMFHGSIDDVYATIG